MKDKFVGKYMRLARQIASDNNPCLSRKVGVIVVDPQTKGIVGAGYNGPPEGTPHCNEIEFLENFVWPQLTEEEKALMGSTEKRRGCEYMAAQNKCPRNLLGYFCGKRSELCSCQHAERNALNKLPIPANGLIMFCWCGVPCIQCTGSIINAGIKEIHCLKGTQDYQPEARWLYETSKTVLIEHDQSTIEDGVETLC
mgnify:CR=1 FL=1